MNSHKNVQRDIAPDALDSVIRWALHDSVTGAEPSPQGWERLKRRLADEQAGVQTEKSGLFRRIGRAWTFSLVRPSIALPLPLYDWHANRLTHTMRIVEGKMPVLRVVS